MSPDTRKHRGPHPRDQKLFAPETIPVLRQATEDLSLLLSKGYSMDASLKLVGDRFLLQQRQRMAVRRSSCSNASLQIRRQHCQSPESIKGKTILVDGFNALIITESALSGGIVLKGRDGCWRDLASVHGSYRTVSETKQAIELWGYSLAQLEPGQVVWILDRPVSNSGRIGKLIEELAREQGWSHCTEIVNNPDQVLSQGLDPVITSDSAVLDRGVAWVNLVAALIARIPQVWTVDLGVQKGKR